MDSDQPIPDQGIWQSTTRKRRFIRKRATSRKRRDVDRWIRRTSVVNSRLIHEIANNFPNRQ